VDFGNKASDPEGVSMDLFEEKAEKLRHKLHETKSMQQRQEVFDLSRKPD